MEHSTAILEEAGKRIDEATNQTPEKMADSGDNKKRKRDDMGGRGGKQANEHNKRNKRRDMGRGDYFRTSVDKRERVAEADQKRRDNPSNTSYGLTFSTEEIKAEQRRPKRKVAVMIGYAGTGYKGMQISALEKTIEGDLFQAFIKAGAISKANADDPKKANLVRCARTDKGVHAAGNMISLNLIIEEDDIIEKINSHLPEQIRVWGIVRTVGSFSCYQACDSRWYEYLIPTYAFLPPHPSSWLGKQLELSADETGEREAYDSRQEEVRGFWEDIETRIIEPLIQTIDEDIREDVLTALRGEDEANATKEGANQAQKDKDAKEEENASDEEETKEPEPIIERTRVDGELTEADLRLQRLRAATRQIRHAYMNAKRHYRIPEARVQRVRDALAKFVGTRNYHNYTIQKPFSDPSAKRNIKSFVVNGKPLLIGDGEDHEKTEWLSLKVHGQSFMMHQIRKMISMVALLVRCGSPLATMDHSFTASRYSIPKVPGLGLMLERPVFDSYNKFQAPKHERDPLLFSTYDEQIEAFKRKEIYARMFSEEEEKGEFSRFFNHVDNFREPHFLFVTSKGLEATNGVGRREGYGEMKQRDNDTGVQSASEVRQSPKLDDVEENDADTVV